MPDTARFPDLRQISAVSILSGTVKPGSSRPSCTRFIILRHISLWKEVPPLSTPPCFNSGCYHSHPIYRLCNKGKAYEPYIIIAGGSTTFSCSRHTCKSCTGTGGINRHAGAGKFPVCFHGFSHSIG